MGHDDEEYRGDATHAEGRNTSIRTFDNVHSQEIKSVRVVGKEESTLAERARDEYILLLLQNEPSASLHASEFVKMVWFPTDYILPCNYPKINSAPQTGTLNESQSNVVRAMIQSTTYPVVIVHGTSTLNYGVAS